MTDVPPATSVRMIFEFTADGVRLVEQHPVNATSGEVREDRAGDYVEVRARDGRALSRTPVRTGLGSTVESFPQDPYISVGTGRAVPAIVTVVVPAPPDADHVAVVRDSGADIQVLGTFRLSR
jgi:hypothetical protein